MLFDFIFITEVQDTFTKYNNEDGFAFLTKHSTKLCDKKSKKGKNRIGD